MAAVGRQGTEETASPSPGVGTIEAGEAAVVVETVEVEARGTLDEGEEAVVH